MPLPWKCKVDMLRRGEREPLSEYASNFICPRACAAEGCGTPTRKEGYPFCEKHHQRRTRYGNPKKKKGPGGNYILDNPYYKRKPYGQSNLYNSDHVAKLIQIIDNGEVQRVIYKGPIGPECSSD